MNKKNVKKVMDDLQKKIDSNTSWKGVDVDEFIEEVRPMDDTPENDAKRLIEVYLGMKIYNAKAYYIKSELEDIFKTAKENAIKCCDEVIKVIPMYIGNLNLNPKWKYWNEVKQQIKDFEI